MSDAMLCVTCGTTESPLLWGGGVLMCETCSDNEEDDKARADRLAARVAELEAGGNALHAAFVRHRTTTHEVKPKFCKTCRESDAELDAWRALVAPLGGLEGDES